MTSEADTPLIGIAASSRDEATGCEDAIARSGGAPWLVLPERGLAPRTVLDRVSGLLLCGTCPLNLRPVGPPTGASALSQLLVKAALDNDMPVLAIGEGMHALNEAMSGKQAVDVTGHAPSDGDAGEVSSYHRVFISPGSKLAAVVGSGGFVRLNSRHLQGLRQAQKARALMASAYSLEDGVIEALESPEHRWVIGVQFRPERRKEVPPHFDRLFQVLVEFARRSAR